MDGLASSSDVVFLVTREGFSFCITLVFVGAVLEGRFDLPIEAELFDGPFVDVGFIYLVFLGEVIVRWLCLGMKCLNKGTI